MFEGTEKVNWDDQVRILSETLLKSGGETTFDLSELEGNTSLK